MGAADHLASGGVGWIDSARPTSVAQTSLAWVAIRPVAFARCPVADSNRAAQRNQSVQSGGAQSALDRTGYGGARVAARHLTPAHGRRAPEKEVRRADRVRSARIPGNRRAW